MEPPTGIASPPPPRPPTGIAPPRRPRPTHLTRRQNYDLWCPVRLSNSQDVFLIQYVLITLVLRLIVNDGFSFGSSIACSMFFRVSWVNRWRSPSEVQQNVTTKFAHVHEQREFTYGAYLVAAGHLYKLAVTETRARREDSHRPADWPLHDIAITNIVWCMTCTRGSGEASYIAQ